MFPPKSSTGSIRPSNDPPPRRTVFRRGGSGHTPVGWHKSGMIWIGDLNPRFLRANGKRPDHQTMGLQTSQFGGKLKKPTDECGHRGSGFTWGSNSHVQVLESFYVQEGRGMGTRLILRSFVFVSLYGKQPLGHRCWGQIDERMLVRGRVPLKPENHARRHPLVCFWSSDVCSFLAVMLAGAKNGDAR